MKKRIATTIISFLLLIATGFSQGTWKEYRDEVNTGIIRGGNTMSYFTESKDGSIWASNTTGSIVRIHDGSITIYDDMKRSIAAQTNIGIIVDVRERSVGVWWESFADMETGWVWFVSNRGIALWDGMVLMHATDEKDDLNRMIFYAENNEKNYIIDGDKTVELSNASIKVKNPIINMYTVTIDRNGIVWFGGFKGSLYSLDGGVWREYNEIKDYHQSGINEKEKSILKIYEDLKGDIWLLTNALIIKYSNGEFIVDTELPTLDNASDLVEDQLGAIWVADKTGIYKYHDSKWSFYGENEGIDNIPTAGNLAVDKKGNVWFLSMTNSMFTKAGSVYKNNGSSWEKFKIGKKSILTSMTIDDDDNVWVSEARGIYVYEKNEWVLKRECSAMRSFMKVYQDSQGRMWIGRGSFTGEIDLYTE